MIKSVLIRLISLLLRAFDDDAANDPELAELLGVARDLIAAAKAK